MAQFINQAQLSYRNTVIPSNVAVGEILEVLSAEKTAVGQTYSAGDVVTYAVSMVNSSSTALTGINVSDDLGGFEVGGVTRYPLDYVDGSVRLFVGGVLVPSPTVNPGPPLLFTDITLPANEDLVLVYQARVNEYAPLAEGSTIVNVATISGVGIATPIEVTETITVDPSPDLTVTKSIEPIPVADNGIVTYTFLIQNFGPVATVSTDDVILSDLLDPILSSISVALNGTVLAEGVDYTYDEASGQFATLPGVITVPAATYTTDPVSGVVSIVPGSVTVTLRGII